MVIDQLATEFMQKILSDVFDFGVDGFSPLLLIGALDNTEFLFVLSVGALCFDLLTIG